MVTGEVTKLFPEGPVGGFSPCPLLKAAGSLNVCFIVSRSLPAPHLQHDGLTLYHQGTRNQTAAIKSHRFFAWPGSPVQVGRFKTPGHAPLAGLPSPAPATVQADILQRVTVWSNHQPGSAP